MHIHCILKNQLHVVEKIKSFRGVTKVTCDNTFDEAVYWAESLSGEDNPDLIFCDEFAYGSQFDPSQGTMNKDKSILEALKCIRYNLPDVRIIMLLHTRRKKDLAFLQYLITLQIYDFHFIEKSYTEEQLLRFITDTPRTIKDVAAYVTTGGINPTADFSNTGLQLEETEEESPKGILERLGKLKEGAGKIARKNRTETTKETGHLKSFFHKTIAGASWYSLDGSVSIGTTPATSEITWGEGPAYQSWQPEKAPVVQPQDVLSMVIYAVGLTGDYPFVVFDDFESLKEELRQKKPDVIIFGIQTPNLIANIKELRRHKELLDVPIAVLGTEPTRELLLAGADECFLQWDRKACVCLEGQRKRLQEMWQKINDEAAKDELTGVYNRKYLGQFGNELIKKYRHGVPFSLLICDLDHFKAINDTYGHQAGDDVLKKFAGFLRENVREVDVIFRYGGEEFLIFFCNTRKLDAFTIAEKLRIRWEALRVYNSTFSGGIAEYSHDMGSIEALIEAADKCLYEAKASGRNQIKLDSAKEQELPPIRTSCGCEKEAPLTEAEAKENQPQGRQVLTLAGTSLPTTQTVLSRAKTVAITSFAPGGGATGLVVLLSNYLLGHETMAVIDGDLEHRALGAVLGVSESLLANHSWEKQLVPVVSGSLKLYPLSRHSVGTPSQEALKKVINLARQEVGLVLIDCGSLKDTWYYRDILEEADVIVWNYVDEHIPPEEVRFKWTERLKILAGIRTRQREIIVFHGQVDGDLISDIFHVPVVKMAEREERKGLAKLLEEIKKAPFQAGARVLVAGYAKDAVSYKANVLYDVIPDPEEASEWVKTHHYDAAIINPYTRGAALLEFDLKAKGVAVQK